MNQLHLETSPYLLQHANNPIHWKAWNDQTLALAAKENKLIIISIGYSACHWCHVMEHESFESNDVAQVMNNHYISIKVDREERPDIDAIYMKAIQIMTQHGGWPLNVVCLPDGRPVWGGTYFQKNDWIQALNELQQLYQTKLDQMITYAHQLHQGIQSLGIIDLPSTTIQNHTDNIKALVQKWAKSFDWEYGGYARAPKFMMPNNYLFLQRYGYQTQSKDLLEYVDLTLTKMAYGGLFDTVYGGFSRYSVDMRWHIPHFEKMLYDNAQLVSLYAQSYKRTHNSLYKEVIEKTLLFVENEFLNTDYAFYSALDADSVNHNNVLEEGAYYVWQKTTLQSLLKDDFELFSELFNINDFGFWEHDHYVLIQNDSIENIAKRNGISTHELRQKKQQWEQILYNYRQNRSKPRLDDKSLTSWNAIMLKGYLEAYQALQNPHYLAIAQKNAQFIIQKQWSPQGFLYHSYKEGKSTIKGFLEDYAFTIDAFITLYQSCLDESYLQYAKQLTDYCLEYFFDSEQHFFEFNATNTTPLIARHFEMEDNVIPASNSVMANNLFTLSILYHNSNYEKIASQMLEYIIPTINYPSGYSNWLNLWLNFSQDNKEIAVCGNNALENINTINAQYLPNIILAGATQTSSIPFLDDRYVNNENLFYICQNKSCHLPQTDINIVLNDLRI